MLLHRAGWPWIQCVWRFTSDSLRLSRFHTYASMQHTAIQTVELCLCGWVYKNIRGSVDIQIFLLDSSYVCHGYKASRGHGWSHCALVKHQWYSTYASRCHTLGGSGYRYVETQTESVNVSSQGTFLHADNSLGSESHLIWPTWTDHTWWSTLCGAHNLPPPKP